MDKGSVMTIDIVNNWPLMVIPLIGDRALQKETAPHLPLQNHKEPVIIDNKTELKSNIFWEKGAFIDIYI